MSLTITSRRQMLKESAGISSGCGPLEHLLPPWVCERCYCEMALTTPSDFDYTVSCCSLKIQDCDKCNVKSCSKENMAKVCLGRLGVSVQEKRVISYPILALAGGRSVLEATLLVCIIHLPRGHCWVQEVSFQRFIVQTRPPT